MHIIINNRVCHYLFPHTTFPQQPFDHDKLIMTLWLKLLQTILSHAGGAVSFCQYYSRISQMNPLLLPLLCDVALYHLLY